MDASLIRLQYFNILIHYRYFEISNQNHHHQTAPATSNCNIFTQKSYNLLERNTIGYTWELLQYGDWITHSDYFERVEQTLISLLKACNYMIINVQVVRIESHKHSLEIVWKYSKKWQRSGDLKDKACECHGILPIGKWGECVNVKGSWLEGVKCSNYPLFYFHSNQ